MVGLVSSLVVVNEMLVEESDSSEIWDVMGGNGNSCPPKGSVIGDPSVGAGSFVCADSGTDPVALGSPEIGFCKVTVVRPLSLIGPEHLPPGQHLNRPLESTHWLP